MKHKVFTRCPLSLIALFLTVIWVIIGLIPLKLAISLHQAPAPQAIFVLGSDLNRMEFAARFWQSHTNLDIWVSDLAKFENRNRDIFQIFGVPNKQLHLDSRATDTVTNFTTLAGDFVMQKLQHIYLITSDYHMQRARAIATIVLGSRGIAVTPLAVSSRGTQVESVIRIIRDCIRSLLWIVTRRTGASFNPHLSSLLTILEKN